MSIKWIVGASLSSSASRWRHVSSLGGNPVIGLSGMAFYTGSVFPEWKGSLFIGGHQTEDLVRLTLDGEKVIGEERLLTDLEPKRERIRDVRQGPDGALYLLTDNSAGRILKLVPKR